jgi:endonuclease YncB( thermonuclease family)
MTDEPDKAGRVRRAVAAALLAALLFLSAGAQQRTITGKVVGVSDGDTLTVLEEALKR